MSATTPPKPLTPKEVRAHPSFAKLRDLPLAAWSGTVRVGTSRDRPTDIACRLHGSGPIKVVWLSGHGMHMRGWRCQMLDFGDELGDRFTNLFLDFRGIGLSNASSWSLVSLGDMADDVIEVLVQLKWLPESALMSSVQAGATAAPEDNTQPSVAASPPTSKERAVNVFGFSMGGFVALEVGRRIPQYLASLVLQSTTCNYWAARQGKDTKTKVLDTLSLAFKGIDGITQAMLRDNVSAEWYSQSDAMGLFPLNGDYFLAEALCGEIAEVNERPTAMKNVVTTVPSILRHNISQKEVRKMVADIGEKRVMNIHGTDDKMLSYDSVEVLRKGLGEGVRFEKLDGVGHSIKNECREWLKETMKGFWEDCAKLEP